MGISEDEAEFSGTGCIEEGRDSSVKVFLSSGRVDENEEDYDEVRNYGEFLKASTSEEGVRNIPLYGLKDAEGLMNALEEYESVELYAEEDLLEEHDDMKRIAGELEKPRYSNVEVNRGSDY